MKRLLQINSTSNVGSTGRIANDLGDVAMLNGFESAIAYGRMFKEGQSKAIRIGSKWDVYAHVGVSRLFGRHGLVSKRATKRLICEIKSYAPDIIHLHNIHGYYINYPILFDYIKKSGIPTIWTFHDCWPFTGHCAYFEDIHCEKWKIECKNCACHKVYPSSFVDRSNRNFLLKKESFLDCPNLTIVSPSHWLDKYVGDSFLNVYRHKVIHNGINLDVFKPSNSNNFRNEHGVQDKCIVLGVAAYWDNRKGYLDFCELAAKLPDDFVIVMVGLNQKQAQEIPSNVIGVLKTQSVQELAEIYSAADVYVNPTYADNFPTVNIEALACGTPVITYATGGSPEAVDEHTGIVVPQGDVSAMFDAIQRVRMRGKASYTDACRNRAIRFFSKNEMSKDYLELYKQILK